MIYQPKTLNTFWKNRVQKWLLDDIKVCLKNHVNIGAMTLMCCYIDFMGGLLNPGADTRTRFYTFIDKYLSQQDALYGFWKCKLYEDFRCGLVHEAIMKKGTGIFRKDEADAKEYKHLGIKDARLWVDIITFYADFKKSVTLLKNDIDIDPKLKKKALRRMNILGWQLKS